MTSIDCIAGQPYRKQGAGFSGWNIEPGRVITSIARKCPSFGGSPEPASIEIAIRLAETVEGIGQFTGPSWASGAAEKSTRADEPSITSVTSNGITSSVIPLESIWPWPT